MTVLANLVLEEDLETGVVAMTELCEKTFFFLSGRPFFLEKMLAPNS